jgi:Uma2 family endonuclease
MLSCSLFCKHCSLHRYNALVETRRQKYQKIFHCLIVAIDDFTTSPKYVSSRRHNHRLRLAGQEGVVKDNAVVFQNRSGCEIMVTGIMTAAEFAETLHAMPEGGRWHELHAGRPQLLEAPGDEHGTVVLNLSRALAEWFKTRNSNTCGYAAHDVGLLVGIAPDTVLMPALSYFDEGEQFGQSDLVVANLVPRLIVDIASSNDRRQLMRERTLMYLNHGVECAWLPDPSKREVQVLQRGAHTLALGERQSLTNENLLPGFELSVRDLFAQPSWSK